MSLTIWEGVNNPNVYGLLSEFQQVSGIKVNLTDAPFGLGRDINGEFLIQSDGIEWFAEQSVAVRQALPSWVTNRIEYLKAEA